MYKWFYGTEKVGGPLFTCKYYTSTFIGCSVEFWLVGPLEKKSLYDKKEKGHVFEKKAPNYEKRHF